MGGKGHCIEIYEWYIVHCFQGQRPKKVGKGHCIEIYEWVIVIVVEVCDEKRAGKAIA
jgi:hypothetical protein